MTLRQQNAALVWCFSLRALSPPVSSRKHVIWPETGGAKKEVINQRVNQVAEVLQLRICWIANRKRSPVVSVSVWHWPYAGGRAKRIFAR